MNILQFPLVDKSKYNLIHDESSTLPKHCLIHHGIVYVAEINGRIKIGITKTPRKRLMQMEAAFGERFERIYLSRPSKSYKKTEKVCHDAFRWDKLIGEWFSVPFQDAIDMVKSNLLEDNEEVKFKDYDSEKYYEYKSKKSLG